MFNYEDEARRAGFSHIIGVDEAGRGPLAGPVVAAAVILKERKFQNRICDSKLLSPLQREKAFHEIHKNAHVGIGVANESIIDSINILQASYYAMSMAIEDVIRHFLQTQDRARINPKKIFLLIDGKAFNTHLPYSYKAIVKGDSLSQSIACASIVAKVTRDRYMMIYDKIFPAYGFSQHKGYPTRAHRGRIRKHGLCMIHRKTFHCGL